ncbi:MAG: DNA polymerase III subunit gamma/tau [bacterium]
MPVIYRKYRPQKFSEISGQENIIKILKGSLKRNNIGHAFLFTGPRGVGKTTIARIFTKAINCENLSEDFEPCGKCSACSEISEGRSLDFVEIDAASNRGIDEIRQLRETVSFTPSKNKYRVYILDEAHMLTKEAFNALLKTLEEPPEHAVFILATTEIHKIPATIISRCQRYDFSRLSLGAIAQRLAGLAEREGISVERTALEAIAKISEGCARDAESVFGQMAVIGQGEITLSCVKEILGLPDREFVKEFSEKILRRNVSEAIQMVDKSLEAGRDLTILLSSVIVYFRNLLMAKTSDELDVIILKNCTEEELSELKNLAKNASVEQVVFVIKSLSEWYNKMKLSDFPQICLEVAIAEIVLKLQNANENSASAAAQPQNPKKGLSEQENNVIKEAEDKKNDVSLSQSESESLEAAKQNWEEILLRVQAKNNSVFAFLKSCFPASVVKNSLYAAANYQFYKERLNTTQSRMMIEAVLEEVLQKKLSFKCFMEKEIVEMGIKFEKPQKEIQKPQNQTPEFQEDLLSEALKIFGGQVV